MSSELPKIAEISGEKKFVFDKPPTRADRIRTTLMFAKMSVVEFITGRGVKISVGNRRLNSEKKKNNNSEK